MLINRFVLHDPPYASADAASQERRYGQQIRDLLADDQRAEAIETFFRVTGMPEEAVRDCAKRRHGPACSRSRRHSRTTQR
ncbi:MAG: hypothetical protein M3417_00255 [Actinomycetota bacterium]|nr:hypothetical protein [Actinomycetota bacterium]